jgi:PAS domain S-box-containing protein
MVRLRAQTPIPKFPQFITWVAGGISVSLGLVVMAAWHLRLTVFLEVLSNFLPIRYNSALAFLLNGLALLALLKGWLRLTAGLSLVVVAIGGLTLLQYLFKVDLGIDQLLMQDYLTHTLATSEDFPNHELSQPIYQFFIAVDQLFPGRPYPSVAFALTLIGAATLCLSGLRIRRRSSSALGQLGKPCAGILALGGIGISIVALLGYLGQLGAAPTWTYLSGIPISIATVLLLSGLSLLSLSLKGSSLNHLPAWLPFGLGFSISTGSVYLWQALTSWKSNRFANLSPLDVEVKFLLSPVAKLVLIEGLLLALVVALFTQLARIAGKQSIKLRDHQSLLSNLIEGTTDLIAAMDMQFRYISFNHAYQAEFLKIFGRDIKIGTSLIEALAHLPDEQTKSVDIWSRALAGEEFTVIEELGDSTRARHYYEITYSSIRDANGQRIGASHIAKNVSDRIRIEQALRDSEERFRNAFDYAAIGMALVGLDGQWLKVNQSLCEITGYSEQELLAMSFQSITHPDDLDIDLNYAHQLLNGEIRSYQMEKRYIHKQGHIVWVLLNGSLVRQPQGQPLHFIAQIKDISDRKQAELEITRSRDLKQAIFNESADAIFLVNPETLLTFDCNRRAVELFEASSPEELIGIEGHTLQRQQFTPEEMAVIVEAINTQGIWSKEIEYISKTGRLFWGNLAVKRINVVDQAVNLVRVTDITERKQAQKQQELQAVITNNMAEGICLVRVDDGTIVYANPKFNRMFGYAPGELNGQHVSVVNYASDHISAEEVNRIITQSVMENGEVTYEVQNVKKDGTPFWCRATTSEFEHPDYGSVLVAVQQDITEHKQAEEQIKNSLKEKDVLLKEIHHRVKNNLQIVSSLLQMQSRRTQEPQAIEVLRDSKNRIASIALVHEKLYRSEDLANIDFGQYIPDLTTHLFDTYDVSSTTVSLNIQVDNISLQIDTAIPCGLIINELVSNSLKYAFPPPRKGEIQVQFYANNDNNLTLIIRDNGIGIPETFDIETTQSLGLTLVQGLVEQIEGTLELNRSQGTEFKITFPGG